ncbi:polysaccharide deacetylase family protein [Paenibacillus sp. J22TS3]|uniref:polysaccharide deacetylase family protein n=1 Tax=Paenibacillus sp. J22TS3 TaxID=2807192 RepID=UPI001B1DB14B|nr:polysaccharide deacetylase family protein [Paenibacillus sp. J22TS3]GIP20414.1 polysaccharide deacetylase family sporulation protein PdaB [Paenibacillus sp. J22TS3]
MRKWQTLALALLLGTGSLSCASPAAALGAPKGRDYYEPRGEIVWEVATDDKVVAITFDDGPDPTQTPAILHLLDQYQAKATFFVIGNRVSRFPELVKTASAKGHEIGNHTYNHTYFSAGNTARLFDKEVTLTEESIYNAIGKHSALFRPPGGYYNSIIVNSSHAKGMQVILWSWHQDTKDWARPGANRIINKVLNNLHSGDIILMHDHVEGSTQTVAALKAILPEIQKRGYRCVTVSELMKHQKHAQPVKDSHDESKRSGL